MNKQISLTPDIKNKERYVQRDELDEDWELPIHAYCSEDYVAVNR